jgi:putative tryptophan/tyrosine transport system substrate-binding protein
MKRRQFIAGLGGAAVWPVVGRAQQAAMPVVGFLQGQSPATAAPLIAAFRQGLRETGFVEGQNVVVEYRLANGQPDRVPALAAELVSRRVNVLASGYQTAHAAKAATTTIPIVFMGGADPVRDGLVASINRPGANLTGATLAAIELLGKRLGLLRELVPQAAILGALIDARVPAPSYQFQLQDIQEAARRLDLSLVVANVRSERDFDDAFAMLARERVDAGVVAPSVLFNDNPARLVALAARHRLPTAYELRQFVEAGGLMAYAPSITEAFRQGGVYTGRVLKGEKPADMPIMLPTKFEFALNLKTAKALGLTIPPNLLALADEVIE